MSHHDRLGRRRFLGLGLLAAAGWRRGWAGPSARGAGAGVPDVGDAGEGAVPAGDAPSQPLAELAYGQVRFRDGPIARQARENHRLVLGLDEDSLLKPFRLRGGQPAPGPELGGWYGTYAFAPGATFGQWMSALSRYYAITGDPATHAKIERLVRGYAATIDEGGFYRGNRFPAYTYDKLTGGLLDAHGLGRDDAALAALARTTAVAVPFLPPRAIPRNEHAHPPQDFTEHAWDESYTLPENQFAAWRATGEARHLELAHRFLYDEFFGALARGENALPGKHAYSHVNALGSSAQAYLSLANPLYLKAAQNGFEMIAAQSFATGGWGPDEHFVAPGSGALGASLAGQTKSFETPCGAYAHFKLTRYLLRITRDSRYGDSMERVLYNTVLGALPIQPDGHAFYYSDYTRRGKKAFHPDRWPCCSGTLPMVAADHAINACFTDAHGIHVNLYVPADVAWTQDGLPARLRIETDYPYAPGVALTLSLPGAQTFTLNLRVPAWAEGASVRINDKRETSSIEPGRFASIRREWRSGDRIELELPLTRRLESIDAEHPESVALLAGPLVLMRLLDGEPAVGRVTRRGLLSATGGRSGRHEWRAAADNGSIRMKPFLDIGDETYSAYQRVASS
ncbi:MAG TPA: beta-L-arabinofuranosidase domain-containing protein [Steroidobacteraceae bacterium]|jgi:hypothetical protein|nr:beta-L-arabinofuranosidase domain-containing protein [Steroidobacteraceae bacterium]